MKVLIAPEARMQIDTLISLAYGGTGFISGQALGGCLFVEGIWPLRCSAREFPRVHDLLGQRWGNRLQGALFANRRVLLPSGLVGQVVLQIRGRKLRFFRCLFDNRLRRPVLTEI